MVENKDNFDLQPPPANLTFGAVCLSFVRVYPGDRLRGFAPYYHFRILNSAAQDVGHINFRVGDTQHVMVCAGHIGYEIHPLFRGNGYAFLACQALSPWVKNFYETVTITCDPENFPSIRTIEKLGATFVDEVAVPETDPHYQRGSRLKRRYRWSPL